MDDQQVDRDADPGERNGSRRQRSPEPTRRDGAWSDRGRDVAHSFMRIPACFTAGIWQTEAGLLLVSLQIMAE